GDDSTQGKNHVRRALLFPVLAEVAALDVFQGHEVQTADLAAVVDLHDIGVGGAGDRLGFLLEAGQGGLVGGQVGAQHLEGDLALEGDLLGHVNLAHAAFAQAAEDVIIAERLPGEVGGGGDVRGLAGRLRYSSRLRAARVVH